MQEIFSFEELFIILSPDDKRAVENLLHKIANYYFEQHQCMHSKCSAFGLTNGNIGCIYRGFRFISPHLFERILTQLSG